MLAVCSDCQTCAKFEHDSMQDRQTIAMPRRSDQISELRTVKLKMLKVFEFNSQTLKSGVVVLSDDTPSGTGLLFVKGAHTAIKSLVLPASLPPDFDEVSPYIFCML